MLKEGRPLAGLDMGGRDAVARVGHERDILQRLEGLDVVPELHDYFQLGEHHFLVQEYVDSNPLQRELVRRYPLTHPDATEAELAEYAEWATAMVAGSKPRSLSCTAAAWSSATCIRTTCCSASTTGSS